MTQQEYKEYAEIAYEENRHKDEVTGYEWTLEFRQEKNENGDIRGYWNPVIYGMKYDHAPWEIIFIDAEKYNGTQETKP